MRLLWQVFSGFLFLQLFVATAAFTQANNVEVIEGQELLVYPKTLATGASFNTEASHQALLLGAGTNIKFLSAKLAVAGLSKGGSSIKLANESELNNACQKIRNSRIGCEINRMVKLVGTPNDSYWSSMYGLRKIAAQSAWDTTTGSRSVKVAVIDTGVDYTHPDLAANIAVNSGEIAGNGIDDDANGYVDDYYGYNFAGNNSNPFDDHSHGTHVAGTIGAVGNNASGVVGVNWEVGIIPVKVLAANGSGTLAAVIAGVNYAVARGADVMNLSLGGSGYSQIFYDSISNANSHGVLFVAAAGNEANNNDSNPGYPASYQLPNVISVAATDSSDNLAYFSNYGSSSVHIAAPGVAIASTLPGASYGSYSGTSMATPHVAGVAALLKAASPNSSMLDIKSAILNNGDILSSLNNKVVTSSRLNVAKAMAALGVANPVPSNPPPSDTPPETPLPGDDNSSPLPGDGSSPGDSPVVFPIDYMEVSYSIRNNTVKIFVQLLDSEDYGVVGATVNLTCDGQFIAEKSSNDYGEVRFSLKLKKSSSKCRILAQNESSSMSKSLRFKRSVRRRKL